MKLCRKTGIRQSMGRVGSCFDNAAAEAFFSSLEWEVLSRHQFVDTRQAQAVVLEWCYGFYNHTPSAQQRWHDGTHHLRDDRPHPRSGQKRNPPRFGVKLTSEARSVTNIAQVIQRGGTF